MCILHSDYRWDFGRHKSLALSFSTHIYIYIGVYMYILQSDYRLYFGSDDSLALSVHMYIYIYIYACSILAQEL